MKIRFRSTINGNRCCFITNIERKKSIISDEWKILLNQELSVSFQDMSMTPPPPPPKLSDFYSNSFCTISDKKKQYGFTFDIKCALTKFNIVTGLKNLLINFYLPLSFSMNLGYRSFTNRNVFYFTEDKIYL